MNNKKNALIMMLILAVCYAPRTLPGTVFQLRNWNYVHAIAVEDDSTTWVNMSLVLQTVALNTNYCCGDIYSGKYNFFGKWHTNSGRFEWLTQPDSVKMTLYGDILIDRDGTKWCVQEGRHLLSYDGRSWRQYTTQDGLPSDSIMDIAQDSSGRLWCVSANDGIAVLENGVWKSFSPPSDIGYMYVNSIVIDREDRKWMCSGTLPRLILFDSGIWTAYPDIPDAGRYARAHLALDSAGNIWATKELVNRYVYHFNTRSLRHLNSIYVSGAGYVTNLAVNSQGSEVWFCRNGTEYLPVIDTSGTRRNDVHLPFNGNAISMTFDRHGSPWIGLSGEGMYHLKDGIWEHFQLFDRQPVMASTGSFYGDTWHVCADGIYSFRLSSDYNWTYRYYPDSLLGTRATSIVCDSRRRIWIGTQGRGTICFDGSAWHGYTRVDGLPGDTVLALDLDRINDVVYGTTGTVIFSLDERGIVILLPAGTLTSLIRCLAVAPDGAIWAGCEAGDLIRVSRSGDWESNINSQEQSVGAIREMLVDSAGGVWFTTDSSRLYKYDQTHLQAVAFDTAGMLSPTVTALAGDFNRRYVYLGLRYDEAPQNRIIQLSLDACLIKSETWTRDDTIDNIAQDFLGNAWVGTASGLRVASMRDRNLLAVEQESLLTPSPTVPVVSALLQNNPNPFNPSTSIGFVIRETAPVRVGLRVYNLRGSLIRTLYDGFKVQGAYRVDWDGRDNGGHICPSGIYFCRMVVGERAWTRKMILFK